MRVVAVVLCILCCNIARADEPTDLEARKARCTTGTVRDCRALRDDSPDLDTRWFADRRLCELGDALGCEESDDPLHWVKGCTLGRANACINVAGKVGDREVALQALRRACLGAKKDGDCSFAGRFWLDLGEEGTAAFFFDAGCKRKVKEDCAQRAELLRAQVRIKQVPAEPWPTVARRAVAAFETSASTEAAPPMITEPARPATKEPADISLKFVGGDCTRQIVWLKKELTKTLQRRSNGRRVELAVELRSCDELETLEAVARVVTAEIAVAVTIPGKDDPVTIQSRHRTRHCDLASCRERSFDNVDPSTLWPRTYDVFLSVLRDKKQAIWDAADAAP